MQIQILINQVAVWWQARAECSGYLTTNRLESSVLLWIDENLSSDNKSADSKSLPIPHLHH